MLLSVRFKEMQKRLRELKLNMLPRTFSPTGDYSDRQLDRARGYRLLVHAEIESYLEDVARECVISAVQKWKIDKSPSNILICFLASYHSSWNINAEANDEDIIKIAKTRVNFKDSVDAVIDLAVKQFIKRIGDNHGVKEENFKALIFPLGITPDDVDSDWISSLNSFGSLRGEIAHKAKKTTSQINPEDEYLTVNHLADGLRRLDQRILEISNS